MAAARISFSFFLSFFLVRFFHSTPTLVSSPPTNVYTHILPTTADELAHLREATTEQFCPPTKTHGEGNGVGAGVGVQPKTFHHFFFFFFA